jgi:hypothetical protein
MEMKKYRNQEFIQWQNSLFILIIIMFLFCSCETRNTLFKTKSNDESPIATSTAKCTLLKHKSYLSKIDTCSYSEIIELLEKTSDMFLNTGDLSILLEIYSYPMSFEVYSNYWFLLDERFYQNYENKVLLARIYYLSLVTNPYYYIEIIRREEIRRIIGDNYILENSIQWKYLDELTAMDANDGMSIGEKQAEWSIIRKKCKADKRIKYQIFRNPKR